MQSIISIIKYNGCQCNDILKYSIICNGLYGVMTVSNQ